MYRKSCSFGILTVLFGVHFLYVIIHLFGDNQHIKVDRSTDKG